MRTLRAATLACGSLALLSTQCAPLRPAPADVRNVTVVVAGDEAHGNAVATALEHTTDLPVRIRRAQLPTLTPPADGFAEITGGLARARREYIDADFAACLGETRDEPQVTEMLAQGRRDLASRYLFWRAACQVGAGNTVEATNAARRLATLGLEVPADVSAASPDVETLIAAVQHEVGSIAHTELRLSAPTATASFALDGRPAACGTPCVLDVAPGDHVVRMEAEGETPSVIVVRAEGSRVERTVTSTPAPPALAAEQWSRRYAGTPLLDASSSMRLLSQSVRARDLLLVSVDGRNQLRLRAAYAVDGDVRARAERSIAPAAIPSESRALLREVLMRGGTVVETPMYRNPVFWSAIAGASLAAAIVAGVLAAGQRPTPATVGF